MSRFGSNRLRRLLALLALAAILALLTASTTLGVLVGGSLPTAGFTYLSATDNDVNMASNGVHLKTKSTVNVKTTYSRVAPSAALLGWHYHNGPVIVTVTAGILTFFDGNCDTWDVEAGHTYIESTGEVLNARVDPLKNPGDPAVIRVEWFTTRLFEGATDPIEVDAPCTP
jgi:hypothetical protein